jgi:DNA repair protein RadC
MKRYHSNGISTWAVEDRPREKLLTLGVKRLTDTELLALIISSGTRKFSAVDLSRQLLQSVDYDLGKLARHSPQELSRLNGIGPAKAVKIIAALELGNRKNHLKKQALIKISNSRDVYRMLHPMIGELSHEEFWILVLNRANLVIAQTKISQGGLSGTVIDTRLILKTAIDHLGSSIIACHNHPSGNHLPSEADRRITINLRKATEVMEIKFLDHIIIADRKYFSFADEGMLDNSQ